MSFAFSRSLDARRRLPNRRQCDTFEIEFRGRPFSISVGHFIDDDRPAEVFIHAHKVASDASDDARDIAVLLSIAIQHGVPLETMRDAVCRFDDGSPAGLAGAVLDWLCRGSET